jgi:hypothetical protein
MKSRSDRPKTPASATEPPQVDPDIESLSALERATEVLRYHLLRAEHHLAPDGSLRQWLRRILRVGAFVAIPALILLPLAVLLLTGIAACIRLLQEILVHAVIAGVVIGLLLLAVLVVLRLLDYGGNGRR